METADCFLNYDQLSVSKKGNEGGEERRLFPGAHEIAESPNRILNLVLAKCRSFHIIQIIISLPVIRAGGSTFLVRNREGQ